ncbi:MAG: response regulator [Oscillospiraceae bacterium]|nr:response regulator [Oscillospiraceae bacterium]
MKNHRILVVDDDKTNLQIVRDVLENSYDLQMAISGETALRFVAKRRPDLILMDLMMPGMDGKETMRRIRTEAANRDIPFIFLTASQNPEEEAACLSMGASDFITKPIVPSVLERRISRILELEDFHRDLQAKVEEKTRQYQELALESIFAIVNIIEAKDEITEGHSVRVAGYSIALARAMGYDEQRVDEVYQTGLLHDVGKIGIPDLILKKEGKLTSEEYGEIKEHTSIGGHILAAIETMGYLADGAKYHHEKFDGTGYPNGLKGKEIPEIGRIIAVADVFDALVSKRHYKEAMDVETAKQEILRGSGTQFDPEIVQVFLRLLDDGTIGRIRDQSIRRRMDAEASE